MKKTEDDTEIRYGFLQQLADYVNRQGRAAIASITMIVIAAVLALLLMLRFPVILFMALIILFVIGLVFAIIHVMDHL